MRTPKSLKAAKYGYLIMAALLCIFGLTLMLCPGFSIHALGVIAGCLALLFGIVKIIGYFTSDLYMLAFQHDLASGILLAVMGVVILNHPASLMLFICIALGIYALADALLRLQTAMDSRRFGLPRWWVILLSSIVTGILGLLLVFCASRSSLYLTVLLGVTLLAEGILNMVTVLTASKILKEQKPHIIDIEF